MATKCPQGKAWDSQMKRCRPVKMMKEVKAPGKASAEGKLIKKLTEKGYVSQKAIDAAAPMLSLIHI